MQTTHNESTQALSEADQAELNKLVSILELSSGTTTIFAVALESGPNHPVVEQLKFLLSASEENFHFQNFFYSDNSLHNFLYSLDEVNQQVDCVRSPQTPLESEGYKVVMAFGLDQLPTPRLVREMKQLNLDRESIFGRELILIFWLNKAAFLDEFRHRAPDFWDWRGKVLQFEARPNLNPLLYPYLQWLIAENSYLKITGVMQVQRQVDIFLDQIYVSLQAEKRQEITEISHRSQREFDAVTSQLGSKGRHNDLMSDDFELLADFESMLPDVTRTKTVTKKVDLAQAVRESQYSVILGDPGAGKTTLLKYLALHFATAKRDGKETVFGGAAQEELGKSLLPILFRIADYAERLREQPELSLLDYLRQFYRQWEAFFESESLNLDPPQPPLKRGENQVKVPLVKGDLGGSPGLKILHIELLLEQMHHGNCLMLLDGLDEVFDQDSRRQIVEQINQFVEEFYRNKFVITSRIAGYRDVRLSGRFAEFMIEDMECEQAEQFLHRWCRAIERAQQPDASEEQCQRQGDEQARAILGAIQASEGVKSLTANPLLLTILALIHRNGSRLPSQRVKLYELAADTLIEDWQLGKNLPDARKVVLKKNEVTKLLAPLAYWMHEEKPSGLVTQGEVEEILAAQLAAENDTEPNSELVRQGVEEFLRKVRETTGLFVERAPGVYGFMHLTFEEYFAARYIADNDQSDILEIIRSHLDEPRWNETILLALGYYGVHFNAQVDKLVKRLFSNLEAYKPAIQGGEITVKNGSSLDAILIWSDSGISSELRLKDLLFAGQVLAEVEVNSSIRRKLVQQLVITYLNLRFDTEIDTIKKLLRLLCQIELFHQKNEVISLLQQAYDNSTLYDWIHIKAQLAILYIVCSEPGVTLVSYVSILLNNLNPFFFGCIRLFFPKFGEEMSLALQTTLQSQSIHELSHPALSILTALSYIRKDCHHKAFTLLEELNNQFSPYKKWVFAAYHSDKNEYDRALDFYQQAFDEFSKTNVSKELLIFLLDWGSCYASNKNYEQSIGCSHQVLALVQEPNTDLSYSVESVTRVIAFSLIGKSYQGWGKYEQAIKFYKKIFELCQKLNWDETILVGLWNQLADCYRDWGKYEQAVECQIKDLAICQQLDEKPNIANAYRQLGYIYQAWGKYEQALSYHQQSCELYEQLGKKKNIANQWHNLADCYRDWGKYEQAIEFQQQCLTIRQTLDDQSLIAVTYFQLGYIYEAWGKYQQAISYHQQSRELYQLLGKDKNVANQWYWLADCYRDWGKYEQAIECEGKDLAIRQQLEDRPNIADAYWQLGRIYQAWCKYEQAIEYYQQSRELYQQLGKDKDVANQWYWLAICYRYWGKYEQAMEYQRKRLLLYQELENQSGIVDVFDELGFTYQFWGKYEQAVEYFHQSFDFCQKHGLDNNLAWRYRRIAYNQGMLAKNNPDKSIALDLFTQAEKNIRQAIQLNTAGDYKENLAYDYIVLDLLWSELIRILSSDDPSLPEKIAQFEEYYNTSLTYLTELGDIVNRANEALNIARAYLEIPALENLEQAESLVQESLQISQEYNRRKLEASARKLLGEIYIKRVQHNQPDAEEIAAQFLTESLKIYRELDIDEKAVEVEQLLHPNSAN